MLQSRAVKRKSASAAPGKWFAITSEEKRALGVALAVKTLVMAAMLFCFYQFSDFDRVANLWNRWYTGEENLSAWYIPFANWDGQHYLLLADYGYDHWQHSQSFYPLFPALIRLLGLVFPLPVSAMLLSYGFAAGFFLFVHRLAAHFGCARPGLAVLLSATFPTAFFLSSFYTEPLYLFLQMGAVYHLVATRGGARLAYLALLPLARGTAAFVFAGLLLYALLEGKAVLDRRLELARRTQRRGRKKVKEVESFPWGYHLGGCLALLAGALIYLAVMQFAAGDAFAGFAAQETFVAGNRIGQLLNPINFLENSLAGAEGWFAFTNSLLDRIFLGAFIAGALFLMVRGQWILLCFYLPTVYAHGAMGEGLMAYSRYMLAAFPFLAVAAIAKARRPWPAYAVSGAFLAVQIVLAYRFSLNLWVG